MNAQKPAALTLERFARRHRHAVRAMLFHSGHVHTHLDWQDVDSWLEDEGHIIYLAFEGGRLVGVLGISHPFNDAAWVRLIATADRVDSVATIAALWPSMVADLRDRGVKQVASLISHDWIQPILDELGFAPFEQIITLHRPTLPPPPIETPSSMFLRLLHATDNAAIARVDQAAFAPPWQMDATELRHAEKVSSLGIIAQQSDTVVGFAIFTVYLEGAHLARLAVHPDVQSRGVGRAILADALQRYARRSIFAMTVNTQVSNLHSQNLYTRFGFERNGFDLPVWRINL